MDLKKLKYSKEWLEYEFISNEHLASQNLEFENGEDKNTEHYRYKSFLNWINDNIEFTDKQLEQFIHLINIDDDQVMTGSVVRRLYESPKLTSNQKEIIKEKLISFGDWAVKYVAKNETKYKESFNENFCAFLESHLCKTFKNSEDKEIRRLWCDGVVCSQVSKKHVNNNRRIQTMAWIGQDGQTEYELTIEFGKYSLRRYARGTEMIDTVPNSDTMDWIELDIEKKTIMINLK